MKRGKYISVKAPEQQRAVRLKTLGEDYTVVSLISRILWKDVGVNVTLNGEPSQMREDYNQAIFDVSQLARDGKKIQRRRDGSLPYSPQNDMDVYKLSAQLSVINRDNIHSIGELEGKIEILKAEYENAKQQMNVLISKQDSFNGLAEQADTYFSLIDKPHLSVAEKLKLKICRQTLESNNIRTRLDYEQMKSSQAKINKKIAVLKNSFENCKQIYEVYADIANTYYEISKQDYISRLIAEEKQKSKHSNATHATR